MKVKLKYVGQHMPQEIVEVDVTIVNDLLSTGNYEVLEDGRKRVKKRDQ